MFNGFPSLPITTEPNVVIDKATMRECANWTVVPTARQVRLHYPALCHLLSLSKAPNVRFGVYGRLYGAQCNQKVDVGNVCMNPPRERAIDRESDEERRKRQEAEQEKSRTAFETYEDLMSKEMLDAYQVGVFVICSATFNPFNSFLISQLTELVTSAQPAVFILCDPFRTALLGKPYLRAFTLTEEYIAYALKKAEKQKKNTHLKIESKLLKEYGVTCSGVVREIPIELYVGAYQELGLESVDVTPTVDSFIAIHSEGVSSYVEALLSAIQENTSKLTRALDMESKMLERDHSMSSATQPLGQSVETQLLMFLLKEQTQHLEALCDSVLLNSTIIRDLEPSTSAPVQA